jgi:hypothetical protein
MKIDANKLVVTEAGTLGRILSISLDGYIVITDEGLIRFTEDQLLNITREEFDYLKIEISKLLEDDVVSSMPQDTNFIEFVKELLSKKSYDVSSSRTE